MQTCVVPGCARHVSGYSHYCNAHRIRDRMHGHPLQRPIKSTEVAKFANHIKGWIAKRPTHTTIRDGMRRAWKGVLDDALAEQARVLRGGFVNTSHQRAYHDIATVARDVAWDKIALTMMAVGYLASHDRKLFMSDRAYFHAYARRFRTLTQSSVALRWNHTTGRNHRIYSHANPARLKFLGEILAKAFGPLGMAVELREAQEERESKHDRTEVLLAIAHPAVTTD